MKKILIIALLILCSCNFLAFSQEVNTGKSRSDEPIFFIPKNHDPNYLKSHQLPTKSFYESKADWQHIIDSTWGPGDSLSRKLLIFNTYASQIHDKFDGLIFLNLNWDSLYNYYLSQITATTSKGAFAAIMAHFAYEMKDMHTYAMDTTVLYTPLNPGIPILIVGGFVSVEHFGAVTTVLPDSTTLVLRVVPDHPLNLQRGDIILGYEGIPWKQLVRELFDADLPVIASTGGCKSADTYHNLSGAGMNWHLFSTIDILRYSSGDTVHLSVLPMLNMDLPSMYNNEQLPISNIPFPRIYPPPFDSDTVATYGILENSNTGYIYLASEWPTSKADEQFFKAINALKNTDALIVDMRFNEGGWAFFDAAFSILFNEYHKTLAAAYRCNANTFDLCPGCVYGYNDIELHQIEGKGPKSYDRPVAVLLGPQCVSMGDRTAHRLRYLPKVRFFGKSADASLGHNYYIEDFPGWILRYSLEDVFHINKPGEYLNRREFPVDYPVWFNKDDVAKGKDPVVEKSLEWINILVYAHDVTTDKWSYLPGNDTVIVTASIENPNSHIVTAKLYFESLDGSVNDSTDMAEIIGKGAIWQGKWKTSGPNDNIYWISIKATDHTDGTYFTSRHSTKITTVPILLDSITCVASSPSKYTFQPYFKNGGKVMQINLINVDIKSIDPWVKSISPKQTVIGYLKPGQIKKTQSFDVTYDTATFQDSFNLSFGLSIDGWPFWEADTTVSITSTGTEEQAIVPMFYILDQNYPNPFTGSTTFTYKLTASAQVRLQVFNSLGVLVAEPLNEFKQNGEHKVMWNAESLPAGIYYCRLQAGKQEKSVKIIKLK